MIFCIDPSVIKVGNNTFNFNIQGVFSEVLSVSLALVLPWPSVGAEYF